MQKFEIKNRKGLKIVGDLLIPDNPKGLSFVFHGLGGFKEQPHVKTIAETFFENNYTVINFDATNSIGESEGKYENATMQDHYEDLVDVITWAKNQTWYQEPFILAGHSLGGYAVARYSEEFPDEVKAVFPYALAVAGELSYKTMEIFEPEKLKSWRETGWQTKVSASKPGETMQLPWSHMEERMKHDLRPNASKLAMPVLFVVGENDKSCTSNDQKALYDLVPGPKEMHIVGGAPHTFKEPEHLKQLREILDSWLKKLK
jgi:pimeloyl-ACP methyl ester carboxylesterase